MKKEPSNAIKSAPFIISFIIISAVLISLTGYSIYLYQEVLVGKADGMDITESEIMEQFSLSSVEDISRFHGTEFFHVIEGTTADDKQAVIYVNQSVQEQEPLLFLKDDWVVVDELIKQWEEETSYQELYQIQYGLRNAIPLLEIIYRDQANRLSYDYIRLDNGEFDNGISFAHK